MSASVPSDSSTIDTAFLVGPELVEFDRHDLPIYASLESRWADAGLDSPSYGASLDRLFGEPGAIFVSGPIGAEEQAAALAARLGLECHAGHGLNFETVEAVAAIPNVVELNIGHFIIGEAIFQGLEQVIRQMRALMDAGRRSIP